MANPDAAISMPFPPGQWYILPVTGLVDGWLNKSVPNNGMLLRTVGMTTARFASSDSDGFDIFKRPLLEATYHPACS